MSNLHSFVSSNYTLNIYFKQGKYRYFELIYYIFVTFRINTDPNLLNPKDEERKDDSNDNNKPEVEQPAITFKKIKSDDAYHVE